MAIEIKVLQRGDESILMNVAAEVFDNPIDPDLTREFLQDPRHHIAVAIDDGLVVGFASAVHYVHPDKPPEMWINEVGLAPTHRRRGLGKAVTEGIVRGRPNPPLHRRLGAHLSQQCRRYGTLFLSWWDRRS